MAEGGSSSSHEAGHQWEDLQHAQRATDQRVESLSLDFQKFAAEMRREIRALKGAGGLHPATIRIVARAENQNYGFENRRPGRRERHLQAEHFQRTCSLESDSEDELGLGDLGIDRPPARGRNQNDPRLKLEVPCFDGHLDIEDYLDWEQAVETFFNYLEVKPEKQVKYVACKLKGGAGAWWLQLLQSRRREGRAEIRSWGRMKQLLRSHFLPTDYEQLRIYNIRSVSREIKMSTVTLKNFTG